MEPTETVAPGEQAQGGAAQGGEAQFEQAQGGEAQFEPAEREQQELSPLDAALARAAEAEGKRDEYLADLQRLAAEFDNFRKRVARDQQALVARAAERLVAELIPVLDDLERAVAVAAESAEATLEEGMRMVQRALHGALAREGLEEVTVDGPFDPHQHEALMQQPSEAAEGTVIQVLQKGYRLGDRVVRPARVIIAGPLPEPQQAPPSQQGPPTQPEPPQGA